MRLAVGQTVESAGAVRRTGRELAKLQCNRHLFQERLFIDAKSRSKRRIQREDWAAINRLLTGRSEASKTEEETRN